MAKQHTLRLYAIVLTSVMLLGAVVGLAFGQNAPNLGSFVAFVVDVAQEVPVVVEAPVTLESGETITVTTPLTVGVELRVRVEGPQQAVVETLTAPTPIVAVATVTAEPLVAGSGIITLDNVQWQIAQAWNTGQTFDYMGEMSEDHWEHTEGQFGVLQLEVENNGNTPVDLYGFIDSSSGYVIQLVDDRGRYFGESYLRFRWDKMKCADLDLNPGIRSICYVVFELPEDISGLSLQFAGDVNEQTIPVELQPYD